MQLLDHCNAISIYSLMQAGCFATPAIRQCTLSFPPPGHGPALVSLIIHTQGSQPFITATCTWQGIPVRQTIALVSVPFLLNKGYKWFFICPCSGVRCIRLHFSQGAFRHRTAIQGRYISQSVTAAHRPVIARYKQLQSAARIAAKTGPAALRTTHARQPAKAFQKLLQAIGN